MKCKEGWLERGSLLHVHLRLLHCSMPLHNKAASMTRLRTHRKDI